MENLSLCNVRVCGLWVQVGLDPELGDISSSPCKHSKNGMCFSWEQAFNRNLTQDMLRSLIALSGEKFLKVF